VITPSKLSMFDALIRSFMISKLRKRSRQKSQEITNLYHFRFELFNNIVDIQLNELDDRFTETSTKLFLCVACLNPSDSFYASNKEKLIRLAFFFFFNEFSIMNLMVLGDLKVFTCCQQHLIVNFFILKIFLN
jgi:hypothetical protein